MEAELIKREGIAFETIPAAGLHGVDLKHLPVNLIKLVKGYFSSRQLIRHFNPDVLFFTGGYLAVPVALAAGNRPKLVYIPDIEPGLALKTISRFTQHLAVTVSQSMGYFPKSKNIQVTGYPTRPALAHWDRTKGRKFLEIPDDRPVILVFGGSKGARSINSAIANHLASYLQQFDLIHISGQLDFNEMQNIKENLSDALKSHYHLFPYLNEMGAALASADLAISRAGASILGEYPLFGLPSILIPYPYAWRYQKVNADYLVEHGAAVVLVNSKLNDELLDLVFSMMTNKQKLSNMKNAALKLSSPQAAKKIGDLLNNLARSGKGEL